MLKLSEPPTITELNIDQFMSYLSDKDKEELFDNDNIINWEN